jgi:hypothetical protein
VRITGLLTTGIYPLKDTGKDDGFNEASGTDGSGYYFEVRERFSIGLGHRRLSIIDLSEAGTQPMRFKIMF